ncbi:MAG: site-specific DNA-methyltransferase [Gammaproteobacteria bacterium]|nr:site-specific DNA-methyltransferase [Gammaproteobacteria bacterium]MCY4211089.1 site-specific DNA-methyltransferase [Gammaproteobacteria bacterium]MCY4282488.1 site-specific DNA-methyltransferase [Gammaproteobacteria bacterium]MCY4338367.1 site-specific DNA-methyltransferase [Gammaproteobacteria bacterium]
MLILYDRLRTEQDGKQLGTVWTIKLPRKNEKAFGTHPEQQLLALLEWIILACSEAGDWVFDPFAGSATTGVAAIKHQRKFIGCEQEASYLAIAKRRLEDSIPGRNE